MIKLNCDASVSKNGRSGGVGVIARNYLGVVLVAGAMKLDGVWSVDGAEGAAIRWALQVAKTMGWSEVVCESDSARVISMLSTGAISRGPTGSMMNTIRREVSAFKTCHWSHARRRDNQPAHWLASICPSSPVFFDSSCLLPVELSKLVMDDFMEG